jgi:hypothetical protein
MPINTSTGQWWSHEEMASIRARIRGQKLGPPTGPIDAQVIRQRVFRTLFAKHVTEPATEDGGGTRP